MKSPINF